MDIDKLKCYLLSAYGLESAKACTFQELKKIETIHFYPHTRELESVPTYPVVNEKRGSSLSAIGAILLIAGILMFFFSAYLLGLASVILGPILMFKGRSIEDSNKLKHESAKTKLQEIDGVKRLNAEREQQNEREINEATRKNAIVAAAKSALQELIKEIDRKREIFYSDNVLYPTYRNINAVSSFYQYLDSGRCAELQGPNGAYNIYETEKRLDNIILNLESINHKLDVIIRQLGDISSQLGQVLYTQKYICSELEAIHETASSIESKVSLNAQQLNSIAANTAVTAYASQVTAYTAQVIERNQYLGRNISTSHDTSDRNKMPRIEMS